MQSLFVSLASSDTPDVKSEVGIVEQGTQETWNCGSICLGEGTVEEWLDRLMQVSACQCQGTEGWLSIDELEDQAQQLVRQLK